MTAELDANTTEEDRRVAAADVPQGLADAQRLEQWLLETGPVSVAFSGGVDSSVVAAAAYRVDPRTALAVTANSPSVPAWQLETARRVASTIGIQHRVVTTDEGLREDYRRNDGRRCYFCKQTLYATLQQLARGLSRSPAMPTTIVSGTNADDLGDYRPGIEAAGEAKVRAPLAELGITKRQVRAVARFYKLPNAELAASPCLASRVAYGVEVTPERLRKIEAAEARLREQGFSDVRVRLHPDELARVEVPAAEIGRLVALPMLSWLNETLTDLGFRFVTVDAQGLRSGNLNLPLVSLAPVPAADSGNREPNPADQRISPTNPNS